MLTHILFEKIWTCTCALSQDQISTVKDMRWNTFSVWIVSLVPKSETWREGTCTLGTIKRNFVNTFCICLISSIPQGRSLILNFRASFLAAFVCIFDFFPIIL
jgi:hypothetical protein